MRLDLASADVPPRLRELVHAAQASGRDVEIDLLVCSLAEVAADLGTAPLGAPFPDRWPLTPDTRLSVYAFAQRDDDENPTLVHASAPFAEVAFDLGHDTLGVELTMLGIAIEELSLRLSRGARVVSCRKTPQLRSSRTRDIRGEDSRARAIRSAGTARIP